MSGGEGEAETIVTELRVLWPAPEGGSEHVEQHDLQVATFTQMTFCNGCGQLLVGVARQGLRCCKCGLCLHARCVAAAAPLHACKVSACAPTPPGCQPWGAHQWVAGNTHLVPRAWPPIAPAPGAHPLLAVFGTPLFASPTSCMVCGAHAGSASRLADRRCVWCHRVCHSQGRCGDEGDAMPCTLGPLSSLIAPPNLVARTHVTTSTSATTTTTDTSTTTTSSSSEFYLRAPPAGYPVLTPLVCFINSKSGAQEGVAVRRQLEGVLNPLQVFDLVEEGAVPGPARGLRFVREFYPDAFRVLVCGGDGTFGWVLEELRRLGLAPAIAVLPLGTGNDLPRSLGWGGGFDPGSGDVAEVLLALLDPARVQPQPLDRWAVHTEPRYEGQQLVPQPQDRMVNNYWSIGLDAKIALDFHRARQSDPAAFNGRFTNKVQYVKFATLDFIGPNTTLLAGRIELYVDGAPVPVPADAQALVVLNLPSCYGGRNLWGDTLTPEERARGWTPAALDDMKLEIVAIRNTVQLGEINTGLALPHKVAQGQDVRVRLLSQDEQRERIDTATEKPCAEIPCQFDGEPYLQPMDCSVVFTHVQQARMLRRLP